MTSGSHSDGVEGDGDGDKDGVKDGEKGGEKEVDGWGWKTNKGRMRRACLKVPSVYSVRIQRLPPVPAVSTPTPYLGPDGRAAVRDQGTGSGGASENGTRSAGQGSGSGSGSGTGSGSGSGSGSGTGSGVEGGAGSGSVSEEGAKKSYYFPALDQKQWLCAYVPTAR